MLAARRGWLRNARGRAICGVHRLLLWRLHIVLVENRSRMGYGMSELGVVIRRVRRERALSLSDLAERAGLSPSALGRIERGEAEPQPRTRQKLAQALGVPVSLLSEPEAGATVTLSPTTGAIDASHPTSGRQATQDARTVAEAAEHLGEIRGLQTKPRSPLGSAVNGAVRRVGDRILVMLEQAAYSLDFQTAVVKELTALADESARLGDDLAGHGTALASFTRALATRLVSRPAEPLALIEVSEMAERLATTADRDDQVMFPLVLKETCEALADLLLETESTVFHEAVGLTLLKDARFLLRRFAQADDLVPAPGSPRSVYAGLLDVLVAFDAANVRRRPAGASLPLDVSQGPGIGVRATVDVESSRPGLAGI
jgi:transcriptional regulator with XRE-family HTH domain